MRVNHTICTLAAMTTVWAALSAQSPKSNVLSEIEASDNFAPMFPFQPTRNTPDNITNVHTWPQEALVSAGNEGFITTKGENFVDEKGNIRRFIGSNICFSGCFPSHEDADRVAEDLSRYGINIIRLHYSHHLVPRNGYVEDDSFIDPVQLERFDYLLAALKKRGIYTYFQLNICRKCSEKQGFVNAKQLPFYNNGIDNIDSRMIQLHKKFVSDILKHTNPYTGNQYRNEPAISMLEITNENSIIFTWFDPKYKFPYLVEPYKSNIIEIWNSYLMKKYGSTKALKAAWMTGMEGDGSEHLPDGVFTSPEAPSWELQTDQVCKASLEFVPATNKDKIKGKYYARIKVEKTGGSKTIPQFYHKNLKFHYGEPYCLKLKMRTNVPAPVTVRMSQAGAPWGVAGLNTTVDIDGKFREYTFNFKASKDDDNIRLVVGSFTPGDIDIADISLTSGMNYKWPSDQSLEDETVDWPMPAEWSLMDQRARDFLEFLGYVENLYIDNMYKHLKYNVRPHQSIAGTQLGYGLTLTQAVGDYCDQHSYWCHPQYPGKAFSKTDWYISNDALVNGKNFPATNLSELSTTRIWGKPATISEYDHPNLNFYSTEGNLMATAIGAFQNWGGFVHFAWTHDDKFFTDWQSPQLNMSAATHKLVHLPACYAMFVRGDVAPASDDVVYAPCVSTGDEIEVMVRKQKFNAQHKQEDPILGTLPLAVKTGKTMVEAPVNFKEGSTIIRTKEDIPANILAAYNNKEITSNTGELTWNWQLKGAGWFRVDTPNTKVFTGFVKGRSFEFDGMTLTPGKTRLDWLTLSLTNTTPSSKTVSGSLAPGTYLLAATGMCYNTDAYYVRIGANRISCASDNGGDQGHAPILCEGIPALLKLKGLAGKVNCWALDQEGNQNAQVSVESDAEGNALLKIDPAYRTVWYEVIVK